MVRVVLELVLRLVPPVELPLEAILVRVPLLRGAHIRIITQKTKNKKKRPYHRTTETTRTTKTTTNDTDHPSKKRPVPPNPPKKKYPAFKSMEIQLVG